MTRSRGNVAQVSFSAGALVAAASVLLAAAALMALAWAVRAPWQAVAAAGPAPVDGLVALVAAASCALLVGWLALGVALTLACHLSLRARAHLGRLACSVAPPTVRRLVALALGAGLAGLPLAPGALASSVRSPAPSVASLGPGWTADRPAPTPPPAVKWRPGLGTRTADAGHVLGDPAAHHGAASRSDPAVVVRSGDTLWDVAARHLAAQRPRRSGTGPPSVADIAVEWPRWYALNRHIIGPDPDLLLPGQRLLVPDRSTPEESP
jgi:nucleoid-associated protein YgaU